MSDIDVDLDKMEDFRDAMDDRKDQIAGFKEAVSEGGSLFDPLKLGGGGGPEGGADNYSTDEPTADFQAATRAAGYWSQEEIQKLATMADNLKGALESLQSAADTILGNTQATEDMNAEQSNAQEQGINT